MELGKEDEDEGTAYCNYPKACGMCVVCRQ